MRITNGQLSIIRDAAEKGLAILPDGPYPAILQLCDDLADARADLHNHASSRDELSRVRGELSATQADLRGVTEQNAAIKADLTECLNYIQQAEQIVLDLTTARNQAERTIADLQREVRELLSENQALRDSKIAHCGDLIQSLESQIRELTNANQDGNIRTDNQATDE